MKILLVTDHFCGISNPNANRIGSWVTHFCAQNTTVYVAQTEIFEALNTADLPKNCSVIQLKMRSGVGSKIGIFLGESSFFYRIFSWVYYLVTKNALHQNFLWHFKNQKIMQQLAFTPHDLVITTAPSFGTFDVGAYMHKKTGCCWVADYRDLYTSKQHRVRSTHFSRLLLDKINVGLEQKMLRTAHCITTATATMQQELKAILPQKNVVVIENGYDALLQNFDFHKETGECLKLLYFGKWVTTQDIDNVLLKGLELFVKTYPNAPIKLQLVGSQSPEMARRLAQFKHLLQVMELVAWQPLAQGLELVARAHVLLQLSIRHSAGISGTKTYTYIKAKKPIIFIQPDGGEIQQIFDALGVAHHASTPQEVAALLHFFYKKLENNQSFVLNTPDSALQMYSRAHQAEKLWRLISVV